MLLQFKVKNFQSIKDEAILSMVPSTDALIQKIWLRRETGKPLRQRPFTAQTPQEKVR